MTINSRLRPLLASAVLLLLAGGAAFLALRLEPAPVTKQPEPEKLSPPPGRPPDEVARFKQAHPDRAPIITAWETALPRWESQQRLSSFLLAVAELPADRIRTARQTPAALALLLDDNLPVTHRVL